jgi:hypothetical protein
MVMSSLAGIVVGSCGLFLIGVTGIVFAKPALAERFFMSFASSARAHYVEQAFRLLIGASLVVLSPAMWQTNMFRHHRSGQLVLPMVVRHMRLYAVGLFAFGALLLYGVFSVGSHGAA